MFSPYHKFPYCRKLRRELTRISDTGAIPENILQLHKRYHYALCHKLKSGKFHLDGLAQLLSTTPPQDVTSGEFHFHVNLHIDSFFYSIGSALDILSHEILSYFDIPLPRNVYFQTAHVELAAARPGDPLLFWLTDPTWKGEFTKYRNALTHELLVAGRYSLDVNVDGEVHRQVLTVPLPDDPRQDVAIRTYRRNPDAKKYCAKTFKRVISLINQIYGEITDRMVTQNGLPI